MNDVTDLLKIMSYEDCDCPAEYKENLKIFNAKCSKHGGRLMINNEPVEVQRKKLADKIRAFLGR